MQRYYFLLFFSMKVLYFSVILLILQTNRNNARKPHGVTCAFALVRIKHSNLLTQQKRMAPSSTNKTLIETVSRLSDSESLKGLFHQHQEGNPLPSGDALSEIIQLARGILFPGYYGQSSVNRHTLPYHIGIDLERMHKLLCQQIMAGLCFADEDCDDDKDCTDDNCLQKKAREITNQLIERLPEIRKTLATDIEAAYNGDPAAVNFGEIISCYPVIKALVNYRIAHELHVLGVPLIPRMISELAHSETGIDIHPDVYHRRQRKAVPRRNAWCIELPS